MRVPLLDLSLQYRNLAEPIRAEIEEVLTSNRFIIGPKVKAFEQALAKYCAVPHAVGVSSGTDALLAILMALPVMAGEAVITSAQTFFATAGCIARVGAIPLFVDVDPATLNLSPAALEQFLRTNCERKDERTVLRKTGQTIRAVVPVHLFGACSDMDAIAALSQEYGLPVIEDAAQALGAQYPSSMGPRRAGSMGKAGLFSFYPSKNLGAAGDAGAIICNEQEFAEKLRILRDHGMQPRYYHELVGGNFRLDEIQAAILGVKLPYLNEWSAARLAAADFYREEFSKAGLTKTIRLPAEAYRKRLPDHFHIYHQYVIRAPRRDDLRAHLTKREIGTEIYYPVPLHLQRCFQYLGYKKGDLPETERASREVLALPIYPEISRDAQRYVVDAIAEFFS